MKGFLCSSMRQTRSIKIKSVAIFVRGSLDIRVLSGFILRHRDKDLRGLIANTVGLISLSAVRKIEGLIANRHVYIGVDRCASIIGGKFQSLKSTANFLDAQTPSSNLMAKIQSLTSNTTKWIPLFK